MTEFIVEENPYPTYKVDGYSVRCDDWLIQRGEIVRCGDCEHMHTVRNWLGMDVDECWLHADPESGALGKVRTEPDGYCAWGERR